MEAIHRLPESELDIMLVIWDLGGQAAAPDILEALERPLTASALHSYLKRLEEKGYLGGLPLPDGTLLWCATEMNTKEEMDGLAALVKEVLGK